MKKLSTILAATAAAAALTAGGSITAASAAVAAPHGHAYGYYLHHKRHCTHRHPCVQPGGPIILLPQSIIGD